jgi:hypothetical protein
MKTQDCPSRDADSIARNRTEDKCARRETWTVDRNAFAGAAQCGEKLEIIVDDTPGTGLDPHFGESRAEAGDEKGGGKQ